MLTLWVVRERNGHVAVVHVVVVEVTVVAVSVPRVVRAVTQATPEIRTVPGEYPNGWCK